MITTITTTKLTETRINPGGYFIALHCVSIHFVSLLLFVFSPSICLFEFLLGSLFGWSVGW